MRHCGWLLFGCVTLMLFSGRGFADEALQYNRDIRPILADNCFTCHGADSAARQADLRLDLREQAVDMASIVPGDPDASEMIRRVLSDDPLELMPPPSTKKQLTDRQKEMLQQWIAAGAEYEPHALLVAPVRCDPPAVNDTAWVRNAIDRFILARMEREGLTPAPEADRRTLARRLSLDLTGLPPDPQLVEQFVRDSADDAYEKLIDRLMASPHWGEHRGRYWLDVARYADTHGIHFDNYREMWSYRDWVISAFNRNMPFDEFTIEQLAGDLLPGSTLEQRIASGFNRCNITTNEGGIIDEEYAVLYTRDRTETLGQVWLGLTVGCAVCHDHKFDPLNQREFYELAAFFNNTTQPVRDGNIKDPPPIMPVPLAEDGPRWGALQARISQAELAVAARRGEALPEFQAWLGGADTAALAASIPTEALHLHAPLGEGAGRSVRITLDAQSRDVPLAESAAWQPGPLGGKALQPQGAAWELADAADFDGDQAFAFAAWIKLPANDSSGADLARMDNANAYRGWDFWMQRRQVGTHIVHRWPDDAVKVVAKEQVPANQWTHVAVSYDGGGKAAGVAVYYNGKQQQTNVEADTLKETIRTGVPLKLGQRHTGDVLSGAAIHDLRVYGRSLTAGEVASLAKASHLASVLAKPAEQRTDDEVQQLYSWWLDSLDQTYQTLSAELTQLEKEQRRHSGSRHRGARDAGSRNGATAYILFRGEYTQRREQVTPATPAALPPMSEELPRNRLGLAKWLLRPEHPLTARVTVNRFWQEVFGTGLVATPGDFGVSGQPPSHPELLDWLAVDFRESGWDVRRLLKMLVMSSTYRQAAIATPEKLERDRDNRLCSRGPRFRMDAEMVRDYALAASGVLVPKIGGPSVKPYQPPGVWEAVAMIGSNTRDYQPDSGESLYRRSLYTFWKRSAPPASLDIFNAPSREVCTARRERTNTPLQALVTLNDTQFVEAARHLAQRALTHTGDSTHKIDFLALSLLARPLTEKEQAIAQSSLNQLLAHYQAHSDDAQQLIHVGQSPPDGSLEPGSLAAWTMLTNELMNLDEVLNK